MFTCKICNIWDLLQINPKASAFVFNKVTKTKTKSEIFENKFVIFLKVGASYVRFADDQGLRGLRALKRL